MSMCVALCGVAAYLQSYSGVNDAITAQNDSL